MSCSPDSATEHRSMTRMPSGPGSSQHTGNLLDFRSSVARTNASGRTNFSAARLHAFSIVFQHDLLFVTAMFSSSFHIPLQKLPFSGCWKTLSLAQHLSSSRFLKDKQNPLGSGLQVEHEGHGGSAQLYTASTQGLWNLNHSHLSHELLPFKPHYPVAETEQFTYHVFFHLILNRSSRERDQAHLWVNVGCYSTPDSPGPACSTLPGCSFYPALGDPKRC